MSKFKIVVLISGRGSNLKSLIEKAKDYSIVSVGSDKDDALGLNIAKENGISTFSCGRKNYSSLTEQKADIFNKAMSYNPDLIVLAGFMLIVPPEIAEKYHGKIINIHPALLPKFKGLDTHKRAIEAKEIEHGCSVHFVDAGVDTGLIVAQAGCFITENESEEQLAARVLKHEHVLYPWVINKIASGQIKLDDNTVCYTDSVVQEAFDNGFILPSQLIK